MRSYAALTLLCCWFVACQTETPEERAVRLETEAEDLMHTHEETAEELMEEGLTAEELAEADGSTLDALQRMAHREVLIDRLTLEDSLRTLYASFNPEAIGLAYEPFRYAVIGFFGLRQEGRVREDRELISVIDFTKSSCEKRFWTLDLADGKVAHHTYV
ncbi:MAG: murein L,D-transpeptidase catalytic domain-containing protein, partial [Catalinimonas sp.]